MDRFSSCCVTGGRDKLVFHLTVVYFEAGHPPPAAGRNGAPARRFLEQVLEAAQGASSSSKGAEPRLQFRIIIEPTKPFSRGGGLETGADALRGAHAADVPAGADPLLFFVDVDMTLSEDFFTRCQLNTAAGRRVYVPKKGPLFPLLLP